MKASHWIFCLMPGGSWDPIANRVFCQDASKICSEMFGPKIIIVGCIVRVLYVFGDLLVLLLPNIVLHLMQGRIQHL